MVAPLIVGGWKNCHSWRLDHHLIKFFFRSEVRTTVGIDSVRQSLVLQSYQQDYANYNREQSYTP